MERVEAPTGSGLEPAGRRARRLGRAGVLSTPCSILIVDEDRDAGSKLRRVLEQQSYQVETAASGRAALDFCRARPFDVLLVDIELPDMPGLDLITRVEEQLPEVDVLVVTQQATRDSAALSVRPSTVAYLVKPLDLARLLSTIDQIAKRKHLEAENRRLQAVIQRAKTQWESTFDAISDPIAIADASGSILRVNLAFCRRFNTTFLDAVGKNDGRIIFGHTKVTGKAVGLELLASARFMEERGDLAIPGVFLVSCYSVRLENGNGIIYVLRDVTARKRTQEALWQRERQLFQAQKMEAVGRLAGGVAHDFNNLLTIILGNAEILQDFMDQDDPLRDRVATISRVAERSSLLTRQLMAFSRTQVIQPKVCDLNTMVSVSENMLRRLIRANIELRTETEPRLARVYMDPVQLEQIIFNLILNARDAMPSGGTLTVSTSLQRIEVEDLKEPQERVTLSVSDTGEGMDEETLDLIFEPFFTTKAKGTGLGLSTVYGIVEQGGGSIRVESEPGRGSTFHVYLPPDSDESPEPATAEAKTESGSQRPSTILLVEDEELIREMAHGALARCGHTVLTAEDGAAALTLAEGYGGTIDLLITDVVIPKLEGPVLAERLSATYPELRVLFISGYVDRELPAEVEYLEKPFAMQKLLAKVGEVLAG
ncbi:MAG: response regulator [Acidobacteriota bacterium]